MLHWPQDRAGGNQIRWRHCQFSAAWILLAVVTGRSMLAQYRSTQWTAESGLPQNSVRGIVQVPDGYIWVATLNGVAKFDGVRFSVFDKGNTPVMTSSRFIAMVPGAGGDLWMPSEDRNLLRYHLGRFEAMGENAGLRPRSVNAITADGHGGVWVSSNDRIYRWQPATGRFEKEAFSSDDIHFAPLWWVGTGFWAIQNGNLLCFAHGKLTTLAIPKGLTPKSIRGVAVGGDGAVWIRTMDGRLSRLVDDKLTSTSGTITMDVKSTKLQGWSVRILKNFDRVLSFPSDGMEDAIRYNIIMRDNEDNMWVGSESDGLFRIHKQSIETISSARGLVSDNVYPVMKSASGDMWIGAWPSGLSRVRNGQMTNFTKKDGLPGLVSSLAEDRAGTIWVGTHGGTRIVSGNRLILPPGLPEGSIPAAQVIHQRPDGAMMLGTPKGIFVLNAEKSHWLTIQDGLATDDTRVIIEDHNGDTWMGGYGGLTRLHNGVFSRWTEAQGLPSNKDDHGFLWFPTQKGVVVVDPESLSSVSQAPRVLIESASIEHKLQDEMNRVVLQPGQTNLEVGYTALSYSKPLQISFRYKLEGVDENWQEVGQRRTAYYSHLSAGDYVFRVAAKNSDGIVSREDGVLLVRVIPSFYRRSWFIAMVSLLLLIVLWVLYNYRVKQLKKAQAAQQAFSRELIASQENERRRIAAELHDSLGQRLIIINNLALFLLRTKGKVRTEADKLQTIEEINLEASQAIEETRALSYALRPFQLDRLGLSKAIQALVKTVARAAEINLTADIADIDEVFPEDLRINFYRIVQEALNNIVKHSHASQGTVTALRTDSSVILTIADNGSGLTNEQSSVTSGPGGFGLTGIRERAKILKGMVQIKSEVGAGTQVVIQFLLGSG